MKEAPYNEFHEPARHDHPKPRPNNPPYQEAWSQTAEALRLRPSPQGNGAKRHRGDIDFLAIFDPSLPYEWKATIKLQEELEDYLGRRVSIVDSRRIPEVFRPSIDTDPVDIMELSTDKQYTITPKSSMLYYKMLDRMFRKYDPNRSGYKEGIYCFMAEPLSWWFSRLLRLNDNDLKEFQGFDFVQVLYLCDKLNSITLFDYTNEEMARFIEPVSKVKEYVQLRLEG